MKHDGKQKFATWLWIGVTFLIMLLIVWLTIFEYWNA